MKLDDRQLVHKQLDDILNRAPHYGSVVLTVKFRAGHVHSVDNGVTTSVLTDHLRSETKQGELER